MSAGVERQLRLIIGSSVLKVTLSKEDALQRTALVKALAKEPRVTSALSTLYGQLDKACPDKANCYSSIEPALGDFWYVVKNWATAAEDHKKAVRNFVDTLLLAPAFSRLTKTGRKNAIALRKRFGIAPPVTFSEPKPTRGGESYIGQPTPSDTTMRHETQKAGDAVVPSNLSEEMGKGALEIKTHPDALMSNQSLPVVSSIYDSMSDLATFNPGTNMNYSTKVQPADAVTDTKLMERYSLKAASGYKPADNKNNIGKVATIETKNQPMSVPYATPTKANISREEKMIQAADSQASTASGTHTTGGQQQLNMTSYLTSGQGTGGKATMGTTPNSDVLISESQSTEGTKQDSTPVNGDLLETASTQIGRRGIIGFGVAALSAPEAVEDALNFIRKSLTTLDEGAAKILETVRQAIHTGATLGQETIDVLKKIFQKLSPAQQEHVNDYLHRTNERSFLQIADELTQTNFLETETEVTGWIDGSSAGHPGYWYNTVTKETKSKTQFPDKPGKPKITRRVGARGAGTSTSTEPMGGTSKRKREINFGGVTNPDYQKVIQAAADDFMAFWRSVPDDMKKSQPKDRWRETFKQFLANHLKPDVSKKRRGAGGALEPTDTSTQDRLANDWANGPILDSLIAPESTTSSAMDESTSAGASSTSTGSSSSASSTVPYPEVNLPSALEPVGKAPMDTSTGPSSEPSSTDMTPQIPPAQQAEIRRRLADKKQWEESYHRVHNKALDALHSQQQDLIAAQNHVQNLQHKYDKAKDNKQRNALEKSLATAENEFDNRRKAYNDFERNIKHEEARFQAERTERETYLERLGWTRPMDTESSGELDMESENTGAEYLPGAGPGNAVDLPNGGGGTARMSGVEKTGNKPWVPPRNAGAGRMEGVEKVQFPSTEDFTRQKKFEEILAQGQARHDRELEKKNAKVTNRMDIDSTEDLMLPENWDPTSVVEQPSNPTGGIAKVYTPLLRLTMPEGGANIVNEINESKEAKEINRYGWLDFNNYQWESNQEPDNVLHMQNIQDETRRFFSPLDKEEILPAQAMAATEETYNSVNEIFSVPKRVLLDGESIILDTRGDGNLRPYDSDETEAQFHNVYMDPWAEIPPESAWNQFTPIMGSQIYDSMLEDPQRYGAPDNPLLQYQNNFIVSTLE